MDVWIVAKTRRGTRACIGAITADGQSVRLVAANQEIDPRAGMDYAVGQTWDVDIRPDRTVQPPHVENVFVFSKKRRPNFNDIEQIIERHMPPRCGGPEQLFDGLCQTTNAGALFLAERTGIPGYSTMFWRPDQPLPLDRTGQRLRYRYPLSGGGCTLTYVGFQEPLPVIPAGALLRVSLSHWWRPPEMPNGELRCYAQLSGWF
ncbi:MAG: hypothetical protein HC802_06265 [Caldilineaceae bacterium]|nr:hypothetical protein [Caldilineaceae bacterium]